MIICDENMFSTFIHRFYVDVVGSYLLNISETSSSSVSAASIFCAEVICGRPPKRNDISCVFWVGKFTKALVVYSLHRALGL